jgi:hypothetical protein
MNKCRGRYLKLLLIAGIFIYTDLFSQEKQSEPFTIGADIYSSYIWRGTKLGTGPAVQPKVEYTSGSFTAGAWGSFDFRGYQETDLYFFFELPSGFSLGMTDYYSPDLRYFDYSGATGSHAFELNLGFSVKNLSLEANYILNKAGGIGSVGKDLYFQAEYAFKLFSLFIGGGNGWLTYDPGTDKNNFNICNLGTEVSRTLKITENFGIPVTGQLIFNPDKEQLFVVVGFTL